MASSTPFPGHNRVFAPHLDPGDQIPTHPVMYGFTGGWFTYSRWKLTPEELEEVARTGEIWLGLRLGNRPMQPTILGSMSTVRAKGHDFGRLWKPPQKLIEDKRAAAEK